MMRVYTSIIFREEQPSLGVRGYHRWTRDLGFPEGRRSAGGKKVKKHKSWQHEANGQGPKVPETKSSERVGKIRRILHQWVPEWRV